MSVDRARSKFLKLIDNVHYILIGFTLLYILIQPLFDQLILELSIKTVASIIVFVVVSFAIHFDKQLERINLLFSISSLTII